MIVKIKGDEMSKEKRRTREEGKRYRKDMGKTRRGVRGRRGKGDMRQKRKRKRGIEQ